MLYPSGTLGRRAIAVRPAASSKLSVWGSAKSPRAFLKVSPMKLPVSPLTANRRNHDLTITISRCSRGYVHLDVCKKILYHSPHSQYSQQTPVLIKQVPEPNRPCSLEDLGSNVRYCLHKVRSVGKYSGKVGERTRLISLLSLRPSSNPALPILMHGVGDTMFGAIWCV